MAIHPWTICTFEPWKSNPKPSWSTPSAHPHRLKLIARVDAISTAGFRELLQSGTVRSVAPNDAASTLRNEGFLLLDVRPVWEREKARVEGSLHVPLFVEDKDMGPITLLKKWVHFGYIGLWTGQYFTAINEHFLSQVEALAPDKGAKLLVACGEGLRSMMAIRRLHEGGYLNLAWLAGGFNRSADANFPKVEGTTKLQYATIGGVSYYFLQLLLLLQAVGGCGRIKDGLYKVLLPGCQNIDIYFGWTDRKRVEWSEGECGDVVLQEMLRSHTCILYIFNFKDMLR